MSRRGRSSLECAPGWTGLTSRIRLNPRLVRGLDYYTHTVFEFVTTDLGAQGTVLAGGRYDGLVELMGGPAMPGVGWAAGIERLAMLIDEPPAPPRPIALVPIGEAAEAAHAGACRRAARCGPRRRIRLFRAICSAGCGGPTGSARAPRSCSATTNWRAVSRRCAISTAASRAKSRLTPWRRACPR